MSGPVGTIGTIIEDEQAFLDDVEAFYKQRGVQWERDAKVAGRPISLHQLYKTVMEIGGYDKISAERMRWRTLVGPFGLGTQHEPAMTFQLKTVYYKNLAAYEIARFWGEEPPPPQILEDLTAKGGDVRNRRLDTYPLQSRGLENRDSDDDEAQKTPVRDKMELDDPGSGRRYPTRELRQDPKRTQLYQPDLTPQRARSGPITNSPQASPAPQQVYHNASTDPRNPAFNIDSYMPREPIALTLRPVMTPGNAAEIFYQRKAVEKQQMQPRMPPDTRYLDHLKYVLSASARGGPSIYVRCHMGLMSGIKDEQAFALHHLVKVSYERGDKFTFKGFPALAEALVGKALEISTLIHGVKWQIAYDQEEGVFTPHTLNACFGTPNLMKAVRAFPVVIGDTEPEPEEFTDDMTRLNEAALVIRNMLTLEENAIFLAKSPLYKDFLTIAINLPPQARLAEFRHSALEMAEQTTRYWSMEADDDLYLSLLTQLESEDRGDVLSALKAIIRIGADNEEVFKICNVPQSTIERMVSFVMLEDDELVEATLDFIYSFTANYENNINSLQQPGAAAALLPSLVPRLTTLLLHNAVASEEKIQNQKFVERKSITPQIPDIPSDLYHQLLQYPEPERSSRWLRCCFEESPQDDITQIAIWQAYQTKFAQTAHIAAADFIKNVSQTFHQAQAQVINTPPNVRFIIKGIKPRQVLLDVQGRGHFKCLWKARGPRPDVQYDDQGKSSIVCGSWFSNRPNLWYHILQDHCGVQRTSDGKFVAGQTNGPVAGSLVPHPASNTFTGSSMCRYLSCPRTQPFESTNQLGVHVRGHIPPTPEAMARIIQETHRMPSEVESGVGKVKEPNADDRYTKHKFWWTPADEKGQPCGIPFMALMVLRNLARFVGRFGGKVASKHMNGDSMGGSLSPNMRRKERSEIDRKQELMSRFFKPDVRAHLWHVLSVHKTLGGMVNDLLNLIEKGEAGEKKPVGDSAGEGMHTDDVPAAAAHVV